jgi:hypothetical protein
MDHWGDPWADNNADQQKSPTKHEVTSPQPPTLAPVPVLLNGFLDDAGWGNEDESFGDWTTSSGHDAVTALTETRIAEPSPLKNESALEDGPQWDIEVKSEHGSSEGVDVWAGQQDTSDLDNITSDTSDTSTTIQLDKTPNQDAAAPSNRLQPDDDSSARLSTSPSETSRNEAPVESPRTSFEEETGSRQQTAAEESKLEEGHTSVTHEDSEVDATSSSSDSADDEFGTLTQDTLLTEAPSGPPEPTKSTEGDSKETLEERSASRSTSPVASSNSTVAASRGADNYQLDSDLFDELFPPNGDTEEPEEAPDDPVYSTSGRKAWYRLTRKQTMREFNSGTGDDNYIRVTWAGSEIRAEVNKTVARWAREDRLSGTGPGARASFYWDTPAPPEPKTARGHLRTKTTIPTPRAVEAVPARQSLPPVSTDAPAAFNWSSPTTTVDPWRQDSPGLPTISSPVAQKHAAVENAQTELRVVSIDLTRGVGETQGQTPTETPAVATKAIPPPGPTTTSSSPWGDFSAPDTNTPHREDLVDAPADDDDDWGEMISSPTVPTPTSAFPSSIPATLDSTVSNSASPPKTPPTQDRSTDAMHIVRLRSTISPTSAIFGPKSFVPFHAEQGPIGPGLLKPAKRSVAVTPEKNKVDIASNPISEVIPQDEVKASSLPAHDAHEAHDTKHIGINEVEVDEPSANGTENNDFSAFASNTEPEPARPSTPPSATVVRNEPNVDAWADADFSFFESAPAAKASAPTMSDPSDPFSVFGTPPRPSSATSSAKTFSRSPPRNITPPPIQPLTGATNSAQRRKNDEDQVIKNIVAGLPDLSYMLRR